MATSGLNMSRRIRKTPYTKNIENCGVTGFTVVNHMLLPKAFKSSVEEDYWHLKNYVQLWDVSCQRQVQIEGNDAKKLVQLMTPRSIENMKVGQCYYVPLIDENAGMINDPVLLKVDEKKFWFSVADSDVLLWAKGLAIGLQLDLKVIEPDIYPLAIQGPLAEDLMVEIFGDEIRSINFFNFKFFNLFNEKQVIARSGYSKQGGFEIYFSGYELGSELWNMLWTAGEKFNIKPGCPNLIERIEGGLLSYGNEFTRENNPLECGLDKFFPINTSHNYIGKNSLEVIKENGIDKQIRGILFDGGACPTCSDPFPIKSISGEKIGQITSGIYSPSFKENVGLSMINKKHWESGNKVIVETPDNKKRNGIITTLPFKDNLSF